MREIANRTFYHIIDRGNAVIHDVRLTDCLFDNCALSLVDSPTRRSTVTSAEFIRCRSFNSNLGPARIEEVLIDDFRNNELFLCWAPLFRHVTLRGVIRSFRVNRSYASVDSPIKQRAFDDDATAFYKTVDWALDLTEAKLSTCEIRGVPANLVRYDSRYGICISRARALAVNWQQCVSSSNPWRPHVELFIEDNEEERLLFAPYGNRARREGLKELADAGLGA